MRVKRNGYRKGLQRYKCGECKYQFQSERRPHQAEQLLWHEYVWGKQNLKQLAEATDHSTKWVRQRLDKIELKSETIVPQPTVIITDTTFWGKTYGVTVFRSPSLKKNLWWDQIEREKMVTYYYGRKILESRGWIFTAAVVDGKRGLTTVFKDIPVQICQFHQIKAVTRYITRRPETLAGQNLQKIMWMLTKSSEKEFTKLLHDWHKKYKSFIDQKTIVLGCNRWHYTHKNVRSAFMSLKRNLPFLFTYQKYPKLNIPNTTNSLEGFFTQLKAKISIHRGLRKDRRFKLISEVLKGDNI